MQTTLHVIDGGKPPATLTPHAVKRRYKQLRSIERRAWQARHSAFGPRTGYAVSVGFWGAAALLGLATLLERTGFMDLLGVPAPVRTAIGYLPLLIGLVACVYLLRWGTYPTRWAALIDQELAAYDPVDAGAYRDLQRRTQDAGYLDVDDVRMWRLAEWRALSVASGQFMPAKRSFTDKKV